MASSCCGQDCDNPRTIFCEYDYGECKVHCDCLNIPVGSILDWPIDYSEILGTDCDPSDVHVIDQSSSSVTITQVGGAAGTVTVSNTEFTDDVMTAWLDATLAADGGYFTLEAVMLSDKGRRFVHKVSMRAQDVSC